MNIRRKNFRKLNSQNKHITVIFIIGVEGTGHHLWEDIFESLSIHSKSHKIIIDSFQTNRQKKQNTNPNVKYSKSKLQPCLLQCFSTTIYQEKSPTDSLKKNLANPWNCPDCQSIVNDSCHCVMMEIEKYSKSMNNGDILFLNYAFSYTFWDLNIRNHPDLNIFIDYFQGDSINYMQNVFDVRFILMKRDYIKSMVSSCVARFNKCIKRIEFMSKMLSVIQTQLMSIDTQFWIMIDYDDLIEKKQDYVDIINDWIGIEDVNAVRKAIMESVKIKTKKGRGSSA